MAQQTQFCYFLCSLTLNLCSYTGSGLFYTNYRLKANLDASDFLCENLWICFIHFNWPSHQLVSAFALLRGRNRQLWRSRESNSCSLNTLYLEVVLKSVFYAEFSRRLCEKFRHRQNHLQLTWSAPEQLAGRGEGKSESKPERNLLWASEVTCHVSSSQVDHELKCPIDKTH